MERTKRLTRAIRLATWVHAKQTDLGGNPYIEHPMRVMEAMTSESSQIIAVLHDLMEDVDSKKETDASNFMDRIINPEERRTLYLLDRKESNRYENNTYANYILRICTDPVATQVKLADLSDNLNMERLHREPTETDLRRRDKYLYALSLIASIGGLKNWEKLETERKIIAEIFDHEED